MSGYSMNLLYIDIREAKFQKHTPLRRAFAKHLELFADALKKIEQVDSGYSEEEEAKEAIKKCITKAEILENAIEEAKEATKHLESLIEAENETTSN